jgi:hypothetical protein
MEGLERRKVRKDVFLTFGVELFKDELVPVI